MTPLLLNVGRWVGTDPLLKNPDFRRYWLSGALNNFSTQISGMAMPLCAALLLGATPAQMGILVAMQSLPFVLFGLPAGVWLDRNRKRPALLGCKLSSMIALLSVPAAYWMGQLSMPWLYAVAFTIGFGFVLGGSAEQVLLTNIVGRDGVLAAQARFASTDSVARLLGPGMAGPLIQLLTAPFAILVTTAGLAMSITVMRTIRFPDPRPAASKRHPVREMRKGLVFIWRHPVLFPLAWGIGTWNLLFSGYAALSIVFSTRTLGLSPGMLGLVEAAGGAGILASALTATRLTRRYGTGATMLAGFGATAACFLLTAFLPARLGGSAGASAFAYALLLMLRDYGLMLMFIPYLALRQNITPSHFLGRVTATMRFMTVALSPVGALAAGFCAELLGMRPTLLGVGGISVLLVWLLRRSPIAGMR